MNMQHTERRLLQGAPVKEYGSAEEMRAHAKALKARTFAPRRLAAALVSPPAPVTIPSQPEKAWILVDLEEANRAMAEREPAKPASLIPLSRAQAVMHAVAERYGVTVADIKSEARPARFVKPRQLAMVAVWMETGLSLPQIGRRFGGRDHTTVLHALCKYGVNKTRAWPCRLYWLRDVVAPIGAVEGWNGEGCA